MTLELIIIPVIIILLAQALKLATDEKKGNFDLINIFGRYGGMPSTHTAFIASIGTLLAIKVGLDSPIFALWFVLAVVVIRDAMGLRQEVSRHSLAIDNIAKKTGTEVPKLNFRVGHKPLEVIAGFLFGLSLTLIIEYWIF